MSKSGVGGSPFAERNFHPHTTRRFNRRTKDSLMKKLTCSALSRLGHLTIGIDLGDRYSHYCVLDASGSIVEQGRIQTTIEGITKRL